MHSQGLLWTLRARRSPLRNVALRECSAVLKARMQTLAVTKVLQSNQARHYHHTYNTQTHPTGEWPIAPALSCHKAHRPLNTTYGACASTGTLDTSYSRTGSTGEVAGCETRWDRILLKFSVCCFLQVLWMVSSPQVSPKDLTTAASAPNWLVHRNSHTELCAIVAGSAGSPANMLSYTCGMTWLA